MAHHRSRAAEGRDPARDIEPHHAVAGRWLGRYARTPRGLHVDGVAPTIRISTGIGCTGMTAGPSVAAMFGG